MRTVLRWLALLLVVAAAACSSDSEQSSTGGQPTIGLSTGSLSFSATQGGANPAAQIVTVSNAGAGVLAPPTTSISYGSGSGWLTATVSGGSAPYTITVQPSVGSMVPTTYSAAVSVASAGASNSPQEIAVSLQVAAGTPAAGGCIASANLSICGSGLSAGGAEHLSSGSRAIRRSTLEAGGAAKVQSGSRQIARGVLSPGAAKP